MKIGDLITWTDYVVPSPEKPIDHHGIIVNYCKIRDEYQVLSDGEMVNWLRWQCRPYRTINA